MARDEPSFARSADQRRGARTRAPVTISRRAFLLSGVGSAALLAVPAMRSPVAGASTVSSAGTSGSGADTPTGAGSPSSFFYIYGNADPLSTGGTRLTSVQQGSPPASVSTAPLAAVPIRSPDGSIVATLSIAEGGSGGVLTATFVESSSAQAASTVPVPVPSAISGTLTAVSSVFSADGSTLCVVLSVMAPQVPTQLGQPHWVTHHELVYVDVSASTASGPYSLDDAPTLPAVNLYADATYLYVWSLWAATDVPSTGGPDASLASTQFTVYPIGSGTPAMRGNVAGVWPSSTGQHVVGLPDGGMARVIGCSAVEVYQPQSAAMTRTVIEALDRPTAKPGTPVVKALPGGNVLVVNPALGTAAVLDSSTLQPTSTVTFPPPAYPNGGPQPATVSPDGSTLYVLGGRTNGGIGAYRLTDGGLVASYSDGRPYAGIHQTPVSGEVVALAPTTPKVTVLNPGLSVVGTATTPHAAAVAI